MDKQTYFVIDGNRVIRVDGNNVREIEAFFGKKNVFTTQKEAYDMLNSHNEPTKVKHHLTDEERKILEAEQIAYGRSMMTAEELAEVKQKRKSIDQLQLEFGRMMMKMEQAIA